jgi:hypothetical protein
MTRWFDIADPRNIGAIAVRSQLHSGPATVRVDTMMMEKFYSCDGGLLFKWKPKPDTTKVEYVRVGMCVYSNVTDMTVSTRMGREKQCAYR